MADVNNSKDKGKEAYNPNWKMEYIQLKGWDNMDVGQKYLATHECTSSAMGMGMGGMQRELKRMKEELGNDNPFNIPER